MNSVSLTGKTGYAYDWYKMVERKDNRLGNILFGDIQYQPDYPSFCKSRPLQDRNQNNVLLPLNTARHLVFINDHIPNQQKKNQMK